jgi:hypothetical protein
VRKLILSRKGFDSSGQGGSGESPLLPDGRLLSLPIPEVASFREAATTGYVDLDFDGHTYAWLLDSLSPGRVVDKVHLDPDLLQGVRTRCEGQPFRGLCGQSGAAGKHLLNQNVNEGDLFLFFGRFRHTERDGPEGYRFVRGALPFHTIWGYLEVGERIACRELPSGARLPAPPWAPYFPHFLPPAGSGPHTEVVFVARERLSFEHPLPGFGVFRFREQLRLTRPDATRLSAWQLPACFDSVTLTYNPRTERRAWRVVGGRVEFNAAARGQEFVCEPTPEVKRWAERLITESELWAN